MVKFLKPVRWLKLTSSKPHSIIEDFTVGEVRSLRWQLWYMKWLPHRTYPVIPFRKVVFWNWRNHHLTLPRPWSKDLFEGVEDD